LCVVEHTIGELARRDRALAPPAGAPAMCGFVGCGRLHGGGLRLRRGGHRSNSLLGGRTSGKHTGQAVNSKLRMPSQLRKVPAPESASPDAAPANEQRILQHALHSFATRGYAATGLRAIAADAQLTAPMVNYYFKTKEALYQRVGAMVMDGLVAAVTAACP